MVRPLGTGGGGEEATSRETITTGAARSLGGLQNMQNARRLAPRCTPSGHECCSRQQAGPACHGSLGRAANPPRGLPGDALHFLEPACPGNGLRTQLQRPSDVLPCPDAYRRRALGKRNLLDANCLVFRAALFPLPRVVLVVLGELFRRPSAPLSAAQVDPPSHSTPSRQVLQPFRPGLTFPSISAYDFRCPLSAQASHFRL